MLRRPSQSSGDGTPVTELENLKIFSQHDRLSPSVNMTQRSSPAPYDASSPSGGLKFAFAKGAQLRSTQTPSSKLQNGTTVFQNHGQSDSEDEHPESSKVTHFENGAVVGEQRISEEKKPLVIEPSDRYKEHWLQRRLKMFRPDLVDNKAPQNVDLSSVPDRIGDRPQNVGLQFPEKSQSLIEPSDANDPKMEMSVDEIPKTEDELARELLLSQAADPNSTTSIQPRLVIPAAKPLSEEEVYAYDMAQLSDAPTLENYQQVPVEAFGMGILLGLGWKEGTDLMGQKLETFKEPKRRPDFLGIGAKEEEFLRLDAKGQKLLRKDALGASWNPLKKINKRTGELIVEEAPNSGRSTPKERDRGNVSTPREQSRHTSPSRGRGGYDSGKERGRERDRDRDHRRDDDRDRRKERYSDDSRKEYRDDDRRDRRYDSDRESKRKERDVDRKSRDRDYDSDSNIKRRREGEGSNQGSHKSSRRPSPDRKWSKSPRRSGLDR